KPPPAHPRSPCLLSPLLESILPSAPPLLDRRRPTNVRLFCRTAAVPIMDDHGRGLLEFWGIRLVLVALVLGLVWKFLYFPVWSASGSDMRILLAFIAVEPLEFVLARVGPAAWIIGGVGAYLIESARAKLTNAPNRSSNRERIAIRFAAGARATFLAGPGVIMDLPFTLWFLIHAATGITVLIALGLYLLWTAERVARVSLRKLGS